MKGNDYQPKDSGKLTNFHYASEQDKREQAVLTDEGTKDMSAIDQENK